METDSLDEIRVRNAISVASRAGGEQAVAELGRIAAHHGEDPRPTMRRCVAAALFEAGKAQSALGRVEEASETFDRVVADYGAEAAASTRVFAAAALRWKADGLSKLVRPREALF